MRTRRPVLTALAAVALSLVACLQPTEGVVGGVNQPTPPEPEETVELLVQSPPTELADDDYVYGHQLLWTGASWAVLVRQRHDGTHNEGWLRILSPDGELRHGPTVVTAEGPGLLNQDVMVLVEDRLAVFWSEGTTWWLRWVGLDTAPQSDPIEIANWTVRDPAYLRDAIVGEGFFDVLVWQGGVGQGAYDYRPFQGRIGFDGVALGGPEPIGSIPAGRHLSAFDWDPPRGRVFWKENDYPVRGLVQTAPLQLGIDPVEDAAETVFDVDETVHMGGLTDLGGGREVLPLWVVGVGTHLVDAAPEALGQTLLMLDGKENQRPQRITRWREGGVAGLLATGVYKQTNKLNTEMTVALYDEDLQRVAAAPKVNPRIPGSCLEHAQMERADDGLYGVLWTEGCIDTRRVRFAAVRVVVSP